MAEEDRRGGGNFLATLAKLLALIAGVPAAAAAAYQIYAVATGQQSLLDYLNPKHEAPVVVVAPGASRPAATAAECSSPAERAAWARAGEQDAGRLQFLHPRLR